ncbi:hypothetical protein HEE33_002826 [Salmonella enterica]|nr:hypothetical protein [Salmonella enterica]
MSIIDVWLWPLISFSHGGRVMLRHLFPGVRIKKPPGWIFTATLFVMLTH